MTFLKNFFAVVVLQFDDSCYVDAKQYHLASFSTRNSTLNTSLRKPIRMQDFIQLCDSILNPQVDHMYINFLRLILQQLLNNGSNMLHDDAKSM